MTLYVVSWITLTKVSVFIINCVGFQNVRIQRGGRGYGPPPPLKNHNNIGFISLLYLDLYVLGDDALIS